MRLRIQHIFPVFAIALISVMLAQPLFAQATEGVTQTAQELAPQIEWPGFNDAFTAAIESEKLVVIDVWSPTCGWCRKQQAEVYTQPDLQRFLFDNFELGRINLDVTDDTLTFRGYTLSSQMLAGGLGATGTPTTIFMEPDGAYITRLQGYHAYEDFYDVLRFIGTESFRDMSFEDFLKTEEE